MDNRTELRWKDFPEKERWKVMWGTAWRGMVAYTVMTIVLVALIAIITLAIGGEF